MPVTTASTGWPECRTQVPLPERIVCPLRAGHGRSDPSAIIRLMARRTAGQAPALRTVADRTPSALPFKSTSTRCRRSALHGRPDRAPRLRNARVSGGDGQGARDPFSLPERDQAGHARPFGTGGRGAGRRPLDQRLCGQCIRASRPQRTCRAGRMAYRAVRRQCRFLPSLRARGRPDAICLMADGDQTGALVEGWYGDITLQAR